MFEVLGVLGAYKGLGLRRVLNVFRRDGRSWVPLPSVCREPSVSDAVAPLSTRANLNLAEQNQ